MLRDGMRGGIVLVERLSDRQDREADVSEERPGLSERILIPFERRRGEARGLRGGEHAKNVCGCRDRTRRHQAVEAPIAPNRAGGKRRGPKKIGENQYPRKANGVFLGLYGKTEEQQHQQ